LYAQEYGWDEEFEALVAGIVAEFIKRYGPRGIRCAGESCADCYPVQAFAQAEPARLTFFGLGISRCFDTPFLSIRIVHLSSSGSPMTRS